MTIANYFIIKKGKAARKAAFFFVDSQIIAIFATRKV